MNKYTQRLNEIAKRNTEIEEEIKALETKRTSDNAHDIWTQVQVLEEEKRQNRYEFNECQYQSNMTSCKETIKQATYKVENPNTSEDERERLLDLIADLEVEMAEKKGYHDLAEMGIEY